MNLGTHYLALNVKDIEASAAFYQKLGFVQDDRWGGIEEKWMVMNNGTIKIGLFQDMFPKNLLTFNPPDARSVYRQLKEDGIDVAMEMHIEEASGPCHFSVMDPDGNPILFDQHE